MFISYAQNFEDVILWRALKHIPKGCYVDIGAQHPSVDSVSNAFYEAGWRGIHVEPSPNYAELLRVARVDEQVIQAAVTDHGESIVFYNIPDTGLSTCDRQIAQLHATQGFAVHELKVACTSLAKIFELAGNRPIHWLKIDVEGFEASVIQSWVPSDVRPWIVMVESTLPLTRTETHQSWEHYLLAMQYEPVYFDGLNRFYLSHLHPELRPAFELAPNIFDDFTLSGTASSPVCAHLNSKISVFEQQIAESESQKQELLNKYIDLSQLHSLVVADLQKTQLHASTLAEQMTVMELKSIAASEQNQHLNASLVASSIALSESETHASSLLEKNTSQSVQLVEFMQRLDWLDGEWKGQKVTNENLIVDLNEQMVQLRSTTEQLRRTSDQLTLANSELSAMRLSKSWLLTSPLRWLNFQLSLYRKHGLINRVRGLAKKTVLMCFTSTLTVIAGRPELRGRLVNIAKSTGSYERLKTFYRRIKSAHHDSPQSIQNNTFRANTQSFLRPKLNPRAEIIYSDLKHIINSKKS